MSKQTKEVIWIKCRKRFRFFSRDLTVRRRYEARCDSIICRGLPGCYISTEEGMKKAFMGNLLDGPMLSAAM